MRELLSIVTQSMNRKELDELHSFSRVSAFHEKIKQNKETKETTPAEEIKKIVESVKDTVQDTVVDTALEQVIEETPEDMTAEVAEIVEETPDVEQGNNQQTQTETSEEQAFLDGITEDDTSQP